jgi:acyl-homoserine-lactone acylase
VFRANGYGTSGNSFVAVVQFGARPKAWAVMSGGRSGDTRSSHFANQIERYAGGKLRPIYFETADL